MLMSAGNEVGNMKIKCYIFTHKYKWIRNICGQPHVTTQMQNGYLFTKSVAPSCLKVCLLFIIVRSHCMYGGMSCWHIVVVVDVSELRAEIDKLRSQTGVTSEMVQASSLAEIASLKEKLAGKEKEMEEASRWVANTRCSANSEAYN